MTDNVTQMHQPLTADDWKFIFDVMEGTKLDVPRIRSEVARLQREQAKSERRAIEYGDIVHKQVLAMRASVVAWQREGAEIGMQWIANTLAGPGHLPSDEDTAMGAQPLFDKEVAEHEAFRAAHPAP